MDGCTSNLRLCDDLRLRCPDCHMKKHMKDWFFRCRGKVAGYESVTLMSYQNALQSMMALQVKHHNREKMIFIMELIETMADSICIAKRGGKPCDGWIVAKKNHKGVKQKICETCSKKYY